MKRIFLLTLMMVIVNMITIKAQNSSDVVIIGSFDNLNLYEDEIYNLNTGEYLPFRLTGQMSNVTVAISADKSRKSLDVFFTHSLIIKQMNRVTKVQTLADTGNSIFFVCTLDDNTEFTIQCQVNEGMAFIYYQNMSVVSLKYRCKWDLLENICNVWY